MADHRMRAHRQNPILAAMKRWLASLALAACTPAPMDCPEPKAPAPVAADAHLPASVVLGHGDARVGTYVSKPWGFDTSSYWIEGPEGVVLIDTQFLPSAAEEAVAWAERTTGKKVVAALVLHPNPDKFNGTGVLRRHGARVLTSEQVKARVPAVHALRKEWFYERYQPDYPADPPDLESFGAASTTVKVAGLELGVHVLGAGCSEAHVAVTWEGHLFAGDLVANLNHAWLEIGKPDEWLARLEELAALEPEFVHPGRGPSGGPELLARQRRYLLDVIELTKAAQGVAEVQTQLLERYPGYGYAVFLRLGLPAVYERLHP
jgi:glyoxylase-like metal-dependent hydrolase (beta-lactamase superfamily II)